MSGGAISVGSSSLQQLSGHFGSKLTALARKKRLIAAGLGLLLLLVTLAVYAPVGSHPFFNLDDGLYVTDNTHIQNGLNWRTVVWSFTTWHALNWHPLTWIALAIDCQFFGLDPAGHHDVNALLHAINVVLLFWVLTRATGAVGRSFMVAALFALHPLNVEAVAWVAELKTVLSTVFFLLALGAYRWYALAPRVSRYLVMAALFALGLLAKPQVIALPLVLLLWDYWPLRRMFANTQSPPVAGGPAPCPARSFSALVWEKVPLLFLCAASAGLTMLAQGMGRPQSWTYLFWTHVGNAFLSYARYVGKAFWPSSLAPEYPYTWGWIWHWQTFAALAFLLAVSAFVVRMRRYRYLVVGWLWFLITLVPVIGVIQVGGQALADRYAYDSFMGLYIMVVWGLTEWAEERRIPKFALAGLGLAVLLTLTVLTRRQINYWKDSLTLWSHAAQTVKDDWTAEDNLGLLLSGHNEEEALPHFLRAAAIFPKDYLSNLHIAIHDQQEGQLEAAIVRYQAVLDQAPERQDKIRICNNIAVAYRDLGNMPKALEWLQKAKDVREAPVAHGLLHRD